MLLSRLVVKSCTVIVTTSPVLAEIPCNTRRIMRSHVLAARVHTPISVYRYENPREYSRTPDFLQNIPTASFAISTTIFRSVPFCKCADRITAIAKNTFACEFTEYDDTLYSMMVTSVSINIPVVRWYRILRRELDTF